MITKKICFLGASSVGKTSLIRRYVESIFSEKYHTTIGVKVDKKIIQMQDEMLQLMIWDIEGHDEFSTFRKSFVRGASGYFFVIDATRYESVSVCQELHSMISDWVGSIPFLVLINKSDLESDINITDQIRQNMMSEGWILMDTSAKTGLNVENAFLTLSKMMSEVDNA